MDTLKDKNPSNIHGGTPLHFSAHHGHLAICQIIIDILEDKNPPDNSGSTPLQLASEEGHLEIYKLIQSKRQKSTR